MRAGDGAAMGRHATAFGKPLPAGYFKLGENPEKPRLGELSKPPICNNVRSSRTPLASDDTRIIVASCL